jgi:hypothetical protein
VKIRVVAADLFHADRQTDMTKQIVAFRHMRKRLTVSSSVRWKQMEKTAIGVVVVVATQ